MLTVLQETTFFYEINKSKFYTFLFHIENEEDFKIRLKALKKEHNKARHHCYAYILQDKQKSNDDNEPAGSAGLPILENLKNKQLQNVGLVVVRYFGGIKLGRSNLARTYGFCAQEIIKAAPIKEVVEQAIYEVVFGYDLVNVVDRFLEKRALILDKTFEEEICYKLTCPDETLINELIDTCLGQIQVKKLENTELVIG